MEPTDKSMAYVGIDIAKLTFHACLLRSQGKTQKKSFPNTEEGFTKLLRWLLHLEPEADFHFCMEATGSYWEALAFSLAEAEQKVSVVNAYRTHHAAQARGSVNKTDPAEAEDLAEFCRKESPAVWRPAAPEVRSLIGMLRRLQTLKDHLVQEKNRLGEPGVQSQTEVVASLEASIAFLTSEGEKLTQQIQNHIDKHPSLKADRDLLLSIPGIGPLTAAWILAELPEVKQIACAKSAAAFAGLAPRQYRSGTSVHRQTHLSKRGSVHLRRALYMPALAARVYNPAVKALYERLREKGRSPMVALGAAMRKLLMIAYGVLKNRQDFDAEWQNQQKAKAQATA
jgi:transposase